MLMEYFKLRSKREKFDNLMTVMKLEGFRLIEDKKITNGHILKISIPATSSFENFEKKKAQLEDHLGAIIELEKIRFTSMFTAKCINKDIGKYKFDIVKAPENKLFIAKEFDGTPFLLDLDKEAHLLIGGQTGTGKSFLLASILTNLIATNKNIEIYLSQIMKGEIGLFSNCKQVKMTAYNLEEVAAILRRISKKIDERSKLFSNKGFKNLTHYNSKNKNKLKRIFFVVEELSFFMPNDSDSNNVNSLKSECWNKILDLVKAGRSAGIHFISVTQRSTCANLPSEVKAQMCCLTTQQRSSIDSMNIIESPEAKDLQERECLVWGRKGLKLLKIPFIDEDYKDLQKFVPEIKLPNQKEIKINDPDVEKISYTDIRLESYNKINSKPEVKKEVKKSRTKKGVILDAN